MLYVPMVFENILTVDAFLDSGAFVSAIAWYTIKEKAPNNILKSGDSPNFEIQVANSQIEKPISTATLKFETGDNTFAEHFVVMKKLTGPIIGLHFMRNNSVVIDTKHGLIHFSHLTMQIKTASSEMSTRPQPIITDNALTITPTTTKTITAFVDHPSKWNTTGTVTPLEKFTETASLLISHSKSTINDKRISIKVTNTTELPYLIKKHTQIAQLSGFTPEQYKHIKPVDMATLSMIPQGDLDLNAYLNELLRTNKPEQQSNIFWFPTPDKPGKPEDDTPIQKRILKEKNEIKDKERLNPQETTEARNKLRKRFCWTDTLLAETEEQATEDILVEYHEIFARHRMDIGTNTEFTVNLTPKNDKAVYSQSLPMSIHLKEDLIVELALIHKYGIWQYCFSPSRQVQYLHKGSPMENYVSLSISGKSIVWLWMTIPTIVIQLALYRTQHNTWQKSHYSANLTAPKLITVCRGRTNGQRKCLHSILLAELLPTKDLHRVSAYPCLLFQVSCASTGTQLSKLTNVLNLWTTLESQPKM